MVTYEACMGKKYTVSVNYLVCIFRGGGQLLYIMMGTYAGTLSMNNMSIDRVS
jgi:hypothetical protein